MNKKRHPVVLTLKILIFFFAVLFYYTSAFNITVKGITPLLILPLITAFSLFHSPLACALSGLLCGIFMDACAISSYCFNAIVLMVIGAFVSVASGNLFNKNIQSATVLSLITATFYFCLQWAFFHTDNVTTRDSFTYLLNYAFPSMLFSAVFIIPFYYLYKHFNKLTTE